MNTLNFSIFFDQVNVGIVSGAEVVVLVRDNLTTESRDRAGVMRPV